MARIRTIKPEFFTSEDIVALPPLGRLLYVALWCEADKEGRLLWKPKTFKLRYFPADDCDIEALAASLVAAGLVRLYGDGLAYIPGFAKHQHINPRESVSTLPEPDASARVPHASARDSDAQGGREGKGREGKEKDASVDAPPSRQRKRKQEQTFADWTTSLGDQDAIPETDPVFDYATKVGLPGEFVSLAWAWFDATYGVGGDRQTKTYADWRAVFRKAVAGGWPKYWAINRQGEFYLTTEGEQARRAQA